MLFALFDMYVLQRATV